MDPTTARLGFADARQSPCAGCDAPCCTIMPLHNFQMTRYADLDYAFYLLNFDRIELALMPEGAWRVMYQAPCSRLDLQTRGCTVHSTPAQPDVCKRYSAYSCFYRRLFDSPGSMAYLRIDRGRLEAYAQMMVFNGHRDLVSYPDLETARAHLPPLAKPAPPPPPPASTHLQQWQTSIRSGTPIPPLPTLSFSDFINRCSSCKAWCCTRVSFPQKTPENIGTLDYLRYCLGFPGVEVGVNWRGEWTLAVRTTCRHRQVTPEGVGRCGIFGQPERPHACTSYDASLCGYRAQFGHPRPERYLRMGAAEFADCLALYAFDDNGRALNNPTYDQIRAAIETRWQAEGAPATG